LGIANSVVNIENSSLSSMGTEQLMNMFNRDDELNKKESNKSGSAGAGAGGGAGSYQRILENISELWDESQYENEYNLDSFIKSLN
jgi:TATA-binding protein-associated factor